MVNQTSQPRTFNSVYFERTSASTFQPFSRLPADLRWKIWEIAVKINRLVAIELFEPPECSNSPVPPGYDQENHLGNIISGSLQYEALAWAPPSSLLSICRESRRVALQHYRVRMPMDARKPSGKWLYFCPEYDRVHLQPEYRRSPHRRPSNWVNDAVVAAFVHDVEAYDPAGIGILHLAAENFLVAGWDGPVRPLSTHLLPSPAASFRRFLLRLQTLWIVQLVRRQPFSRPAKFRGGLRRQIPSLSFPIMPFSGAYDLLDPDPRPLDDDIGKLQLDEDPDRIIRKWETIERIFGVHQGEENGDGDKVQRQISYVLALPNAFMREMPPHHPEGIKYRRIFSDVPESAPTEEKKLTIEQQELEDWRRANILRASGFWVLTPEKMNMMRTYIPEAGGYVVNFTGARPVLGLFNV